MPYFLEDVSNKIYQTHTHQLDDIAIIIPNRRASVYIQKYLASIIKKPFFAPKIKTINEWIDENTPQQILTQTEMLFVFYEVYVEVEKGLKAKKDQIETFDNFIKWAKIILSDFDEIDRYMISTKEIFRDLRNIKDIEQWDLWSFNTQHNKGELSEGQQKFMDLWDKLPQYYQKLNDKLKVMNATYQGKAYQNFAKKTQLISPEKFLHYYFVGFNALSEAEIQIIENLKRQNKATVYFDVDTHYVSNYEHEAGHFYRYLKNRFKINDKDESHKIPSNINQIPKKIEVIETAQQVAQAKIAGDIIKNKINLNELSQTAILLADESLLIPLSKSLPPDLDELKDKNGNKLSVNITMGYPIKYSHLKSLFDLIFDFQFNLKKFNNTKDIYYKTLLKFLDHPFIQILINNQQKIIDFEKKLISNNTIFISHNTFKAEFKDLDVLQPLLLEWHNDIEKGFEIITTFIETLYQKFKKNQTAELEVEILYHFSKGITKFKQIWSKYKYPLELKSFKKLFDQFWQNESLSFLGNPVEGLQIMGVLESRTLDFKNLIVLGMNEGNLPKSNFTNSLIPYELKRHHQLPVEHDRDAIFAHHFYRLLHQAQNVFLTYNSTSEGFGSSERSRFLIQLQNELNQEKYGHKINNYTYSGNDKNADIKDTVYKLNQAAEEKLDELFEKGLSPSALNTFIKCPLDFYYKYILGLREANEIEEQIEASTFGTFIHDVLEDIYKDNFLTPNKKLTVEPLKAEKILLPKRLKDKYLGKPESNEKNKSPKFNENDIKYGQNKLAFEVSLNLLNKFINQQILEIEKHPSTPIYIKSLEETLSTQFKKNINHKERLLKLSGKADRIDQFGSIYRIIDYKSGKCDDQKVTISKPNKNNTLEDQIEKLMSHKDKGYARQLLMYALMYKNTYPNHHQFTAGIISLINIKKWLQNVRINGHKEALITDEILEIFKLKLFDIIEQMYDYNFEYKHNPDSKYCDYCGI
jgi:hypothetical protein